MPDYRHTLKSAGIGMALCMLAACARPERPVLASAPAPDETIQLEQEPPVFGEEIDRAGPRLRVCVWNIQKLGFTNKPPRPPRDYKQMAKTMTESCDVVGVIEVMALVTGQKQPGYDFLGDALGDTWGRDITLRPLPGKGDQNDEKYAFFWRKSRVHQCSGFRVRTYPNARRRFSRPPSASCFEAPPGNTKFDFLLALYHAPRPALLPSREMREFGAVAVWLEQQRPGEKDLFIAGDFNQRPRGIDGQLARHRQPTGAYGPNELVNVFSGAKGGTTLNSRGDPSRNHFDHFVIVYPQHTQEKLSEQVVDGRRFVPSVPGRNTPQKRNVYFTETVSDHLLIRVIFSTLGPDDDP